MEHKKLHRIILVLIFLTFACTIQAQQLRVLTYNIHHGEDVNGQLNLQQIAAIINKTKPDVVALQEVDSVTNRTNKTDQLQQLAALTGMNYFYGKSMNYDGGGYGVGILTKWAITDSFITPLPGFANSEPRVMATVTLRLKNDKRVLFSSTHLDHVKDPAERIEQAKKIQAVFSAINMPSVLAGDFNAQPDESTMKDVIRHLFEDTDPTGRSLSFPSGEPKIKIDYVLVSRNHRWKKIRYEVIEDKSASDHRPVLSVIELQ